MEAILKQIKSLLTITLGNLLLASSVCFFYKPGGFVSGGATGIGLSLDRQFGLPISRSVLAMNIVFFLIGFLALGKRFAATTLMSTFLYPFFLEVLGYITIPASITQDTMLSAIFASLLCGAGLGLVFKEGASTGGIDILVMVAHKKKGLPLEAGMYLTDGLIILGQALFSEPYQILYGLLILLLASFVIGRVEFMGNSQYQLLIISPKHQQMREELLHTMDTGVTLLDIENGMQRTASQAVLTVIPKRKLNDIKKLIQKIDPNAFITIHEIKEVRGQGFSLNRVYGETIVKNTSSGSKIGEK